MQAQNKKVALIGDVGGTNIRLELVEVLPGQDNPHLLKEGRLEVANFDVFQAAIEAFLIDVKAQDRPNVAVIGIAGPISQNTVFMANVAKWGVLDGFKLGQSLKIAHFVFANDFEAASYGVLAVSKEEFVSVNGLQANPGKVRGIMGPGTGLGNSVLYPIKKKDKTEIFVIPSEGGHTDFPTVDQETAEYFQFFKKEGGFPYISLERSFCGPSLPFMFKFFAAKHPEDLEGKGEVPTPQKIIETAMGPNPPRIHENVLRLFVKIYSAAVANFVAQHITVGGMYLVGGLTKSILPKIVGTDFFEGYRQRHAEVAKLVEGVPIVVCNQVELGLKGAFFIARRIFADNP